MNDRPTPETDAAWKEGNAIREWTCQKLERERDEAREALEYIAHSGLSARFLEDYAREFLKSREGAK